MKKILNIFASISLVTTGVSSVVACGSGTKTNTNDEKLVSDIINHLKNKTFFFDENINGYQNFTYYRSTVLADIQSKLTNQEKNLVILPSSDNTKTLNAQEPTNIDVDIQSHKVSGHVDVSVKLNNDAQSIADKLDTKTITVYNPQPGPSADFTTLSPINSYQSQIETQIRQLLSSKGVKIVYGIKFNWTDPKTQLIDNLSWVSDAIIGLTVNVGAEDTSHPIVIRVKLAFSPNYAEQKREIDDLSVGSIDFPEEVYTGGKSITSTKLWNEYNIDGELNTSWDFGDFEQYVSYDKKSILKYGSEYNPQTKRKEKIRNAVKMYCPLLGKTKTSPRTFYVVVN